MRFVQVLSLAFVPLVVTLTSMPKTPPPEHEVKSLPNPIGPWYQDCSPDQEAELGAAVREGKEFVAGILRAREAMMHLENFGQLSSWDLRTIESRFFPSMSAESGEKITNIFRKVRHGLNKVTLICEKSCSAEGVAAYVQQPRARDSIFVCTDWYGQRDDLANFSHHLDRAHLASTRGSSLVHEMMHLRRTQKQPHIEDVSPEQECSDTRDLRCVAYRPSRSKSLALQSPKKAFENADNYVSYALEVSVGCHLGLRPYDYEAGAVNPHSYWSIPPCGVKINYTLMERGVCSVPERLDTLIPWAGELDNGGVWQIVDHDIELCSRSEARRSGDGVERRPWLSIVDFDQP